MERYKSLSNSEAKNNDTPSLITKDEEYINDLDSVANTFNNFFITFFIKLFTQKSNFQKNHSGISCHEKSMILA